MAFAVPSRSAQLTSVRGILIGSLLLSALLSVAWLVQPTSACNEQVCASVVSKCMLTASCKCDLKNCSCCKECYNCLSYLYAECCSCVDMCPKPNATRTGLSSKSHVEDLEGIPGLYKALTDSDEDNWSTITYPVDVPSSAQFGAKFDWQLSMISNGNVDQKLDAASNAGTPATPQQLQIVTYNCTVAFMSQCLSWNKCKTNCQSMGASSYRWFHDGCCECIGDKCLNYGVNESRCLECPDSARDGDGTGEPHTRAHEDDLDYGHVNGPMDGSSDMHL